MGRIAGGGLVACLWLWTSTGRLSAAGTADPSPATSYQTALDRFNHGDYARAMDELEQLPASRNTHVQADRLNLKGAIYLREHRNDDARTAFAEAARLDPGLLAAHYNVVEISFREKRYAESHRQFSALLAQMGQSGHMTERSFIEYKLVLGDLLDGKEQPALDFIAAHRADEQPPLAWFYLNAALERQHGHEARADAWLQQAGAHYTPVAEQVFADSFSELGWSPRAGSGAERLAAHDDRAHAPVPTVKTTPQVVTLPAIPVNDHPAAPGRLAKPAAVNDTPAQLAVVSVFPDNRPAPAASVPVRANTRTDDPRSSFHFDGRLVSGKPEVEEMPPSEVGLVTSLNESIDPAHGTSAAAGVFAKPSSGHKAHASPSPSASPDDGQSSSSSPLPSPDASVSPTPKADATPSGTPSPAFVQKYEAAMVQFLQKDYVGATKLLDEADAIQGGQPNSVTLRNQIFKQYYEAAYAAYQHAEYPAALTQLDGADATHSTSQNQSDAYNLRGLVLSKQRNYEGAENMFHKAVQTDPGLWAAKFNYAEVPFNYRNFTVARARFEELFSQTDPVKQPVEAELTQFKVFLTLLLEGKEDAARTFMQHFNFSGATPARYFCQAALNFYSGDVDKAQGWIDSARKEYPPRKSSSFLEAFYRVGWLTDPNTPETGARSTAAAAASPSVTPAVAAASPSPTPAPVAMATPKPSASVAAASATPTASPAVAMATPPVVPAFRVLVTPPPVASTTPAASPSPAATLLAKASPSVAPSATPAPSLLAKASPAPSATPLLLAKASATPTVPPSPSPTASATPAPTALAKATPSASASSSVSPSPSPALVKATPTVTPVATPAPAVVKASATPSPTASATAIAVASPKPTASLPAVVVTTPSPTPSASATPSESPEATPEDGSQASEQSAQSGGDILRVLVVGAVGLYFLYVVGRIGLAATGRKSKRGPTADASTSSQKTKEADEVELKR